MKKASAEGFSALFDLFIGRVERAEPFRPFQSTREAKRPLESGFVLVMDGTPQAIKLSGQSVQFTTQAIDVRPEEDDPQVLDALVEIALSNPGKDPLLLLAAQHLPSCRTLVLMALYPVPIPVKR